MLQCTSWFGSMQVRASGVLERLTDTERRQQEALFEVLTSEASYQRSLHLLSDHFAQGLQGTIEPREWDALFGSLAPLREASKQLLARLNQAWDGPLLCEREVCNALQEHASQYGASYVRYCSHQGHQERLLRELTASRPDVAAQLRDLEVAPNCQGLRLHSFLLLPMQRVTRLPLLADALLKHVPDSTPARDAIGALNQGFRFKFEVVYVHSFSASVMQDCRGCEKYDEVIHRRTFMVESMVRGGKL
ncbi:hypothetical protein HPB51_007431 [Rhipicephalus microplus]|uniref:DH domain-containing protein n=1 Tax=Rhipicephalus microplus TaxID=6941 RepID=A0A9J6EYY6_RHIMP|nr:hypothetical protein HPB51_007431 [Rhipicephalus microplus]